MIRRVLTIAALAGMTFAPPPPALADIVRASTGSRRVELDRMELTRFPDDRWSALSAWTNGAALSPSAVEGKAVLIMAWASWQPASLKAAPVAQSMLAKYGEKGLIVLGVHNKQGWDEAAALAKDKGWSFPIANDASGDFRKGLKIDHDPEFYLLDRAGHVRYASITTASVEEACAELVAETKEQASDLPRIRKEREADDLAKSRKTTNINTKFDLSTLPAVPPGYSPPPQSAYKHVDWPKNDPELGKEYGVLDQQTGKFKENKIAFSPAGYYPAKPETQGRAICIYVWHPDLVTSYSKVMPQMDLLQQSNQRDLAVIGAIVPIANLDSQRANQQGAEAESAEQLRRKYLAFVGARQFKHALAADLNGTTLSSLSNAAGGGGGKFPLPGAMLVSSDGIIRWVGYTNSPDFKYAVDAIIAADPAVQARRAADRAYIEKAQK